MSIEIQQSKLTAKCQPLNGNDVPAKIARNKPIVMSTQRYNKIINNAYKFDKIKAQDDLEKEQKYREYLKQGSDELVANFKGNMQRTQEQKIQQVKEHLDKKFQMAIESNEQAKENEARERNVKLARAHALVEKLKPGPRAIRSAAMQSEVLRARNAQIELKHEFQRAIVKQDCRTQKQCEDTNLGCVNEDYQRNNERQKNLKEYKQELLNTIKFNQEQKEERKKRILAEQKAALQALDMEIKMGIEKEKNLMEKKRNTLRNNALEAMKMVEQRRLRNQMKNEVEDRLCCLYNTGKSELEKLREEHNKALKEEFQRKIDSQSEQLPNLTKKAETMEAERVKRDISKMQLKFTAAEQEKIRRNKAAKQAHIEACLHEMQQLKLAKQKREEEKRFEMAQRFKNEEVNCLFQAAVDQQIAKNAREFTANLNEQIAEIKNRRIIQKKKELDYRDDTAERQHKFFFDYAYNLMVDAQKKGRNLYPFVKVIEQYKRENGIGIEPKTPKHLISQINIGRTAQLNENNKTTTAYNDMINSYMKVYDLIAKINENKLQVAACNDANNPATSTGATRKKYIPKECSSNSLAVQRYSVEELKNMNQFSVIQAKKESMSQKSGKMSINSLGTTAENVPGNTNGESEKAKGSTLNAAAPPFTPSIK